MTNQPPAIQTFQMPHMPRIPVRTIASIFCVILLIILTWTSFYTVQAESEAVVLRFGKFLKTVEPGLHFKLPFGIDQVTPTAPKRVQSMIPLQERYENEYAPRIQRFLEEVEGVDATGIPEPHLPLWGNAYERSAQKIAFIGQDTRYWHSMADFQAAGKQSIRDVLFKRENVFRDLLFTNWTNNFGTSFWDTVLQLLAGFHSIDDWRQLKRRQRGDVLQTFVWAQTNAVELWTSSPSKAGADYDNWLRFKTASERHLDFLSSILNVFRPDVAIVMNWGVRDQYWDLPLTWNTIGDHFACAFEPDHRTHVIHCAHATWLGQNRDRRAKFFKQILQWQKDTCRPVS